MASNSGNRGGGKTPAPSPTGKQPSSPEPTRGVEDAVATAIGRQAYTKERHHFLINVQMAMAVSFVICLMIIAFLATRPPRVEYFSITQDGRMQVATPVDRPKGDRTELLNWISNAVVKAYTLDFVNYRAEQQEAMRNFTPAGWRNFSIALRDAGVLTTVLETGYVTSAVPTATPIVDSEGLVQGVYAYRLHVPLLLTYHKLKTDESRTLMIDTIVVRRPETENPDGYGIATLVSK